MDRILCLLILAAACGGCLKYSPEHFPLQPGETITFRDRARADEFRTRSGNDAYGRGTNVVTITRPTLVSCE